MQGIEQRLRLLLPDGLALIGRNLLDLTLDLVDPRELLQRELGDLAAYFGDCDRSFRRIVTGGLRGVFSAVPVT